MKIYILILLLFSSFFIGCEKKTFTPKTTYKPSGDYLTETLKETDNLLNKINNEKKDNSEIINQVDTSNRVSDIKTITVNKILIKKAMKFKKKGEYERALNILLDLLKDEPKNISILENISELFASLNNFKQSNIYAERILKLDDKNIFALTTIASVYAKNDQTDKAIKAYKKLIKISPNYILYHNIGVLYEKLKKFKKAFEYYKKAIRLNKSEEGYYSLALLAKKLRDNKNFINYLEKAVKIGKSIKIKRILAKEYLNQKRYNKAEIIYTEISKKTNSIDDFNGLASAYLLEGKYTNAERTYLNALKITPNNKELLYNIAICYLKMKNPQKMKIAIKNYERKGASITEIRKLKVYLSKISK